MKLYGALLDQAAGTPVRETAAAIDHTAEVLLRRARFLNADDRQLFTFALTTRLSRRRIAELFGQPLATVSRRLKKLNALLTEPHIVQLIDGPCHLEPADRHIAIGFFLQRQTHKQLSEQHDLPAHQVARRIEYFKGWLKGVNGKG